MKECISEPLLDVNKLGDIAVKINFRGLGYGRS